MGLLAVALGVPPPDSGSWVWGNRNPRLLPDNEPQQSVLQGRQGRPVRPAPRDVTSFFKSIGAREQPRTPFNGIENTREQEKLGKNDSIRPSPIDTTFESQFDEFDQQNVNAILRDIKKIPQQIETSAPDIIKSIITAGEYPFPFVSKPIDLGDGTSIGWAPQDTLLVRENPEQPDTSKPHQQTTSVTITGEDDPRYTTLDKLFDSREPALLPDTHSLSNEVLGGLHPDEVYYADKDIVIIKGGGFSSKNNINVNDINNDIEQGTLSNSIKPADDEQAGNDIQLIDVRPIDEFAKVPLPFRFINGNIPTIVKAADSAISIQSNRRYQPLQSNGFRPLRQNAFMPFNSEIRRFSYEPSSSNQISRYSAFPEPLLSDAPLANYQSLDEDELMEASPSEQQIFSVVPHVKRSTGNKVVQYHYQARGNSNKPIVDYKIHQNGQTDTDTTKFVHQPTSLNNIATAAKESVGNIKETISEVKDTTITQTSAKESLGNIKETNSEVNDNTITQDNAKDIFSELEDLSVPEGTPSFIPKTQVPKRPPTALRPQIDNRPTTPQEVHASQAPTKTSFKPSIQLPPNFQTSLPKIHNFQPSQQPQRASSGPSLQSSKAPLNTHFSAGPGREPVSLAGDTRVNFLPPLPAMNHQAEFLLRQPLISHNLNSINARPNFVNAQVRPSISPEGQRFFRGGQHPMLHQQIPTVFRQPPQLLHQGQVIHQGPVLLHQVPAHMLRQGPQRFMEPRRRQPARARKAPRL